MLQLQSWVLLSGFAALGALGGCVVHDGKPDAEPIWWPAFVIHESTAPAVVGYTSPGPSNTPVGGHAGPVRIGANTNVMGATLAGYQPATQPTTNQK
jgi:hypothetical protein